MSVKEDRHVSKGTVGSWTYGRLVFCRLESRRKPAVFIDLILESSSGRGGGFRSVTL